jgi:hypothetical protein
MPDFTLLFVCVDCGLVAPASLWNVFPAEPCRNCGGKHLPEFMLEEDEDEEEEEYDND